MMGLGLLLVALLAVAGVGAYWFASRDSGDDDNGGIDSTTGEKTTSIEVSAAQESTDTTIDIARGDRVEITAERTIRDDINGYPNRRFEPDGVPDQNGEHPSDPFAGVFPHAALLGKIGDGDGFLVGADTTFTAQDSGRLILFVNDSGFDDNDGRFLAVVTVTPG